MANEAAWRAWAAEAPPHLLEDFNRNSYGVMKEVRKRFPVDCGNRHPQYQDLRRQTVEALNLLACQLEEENDAGD